MFVLLILIIGGMTLLATLAIAFGHSASDSFWFRALRFASGACLFFGGAGFFGTALLSTSSSNLIPDSYEWPMGTVDGVLQLGEFYVAPHNPTGRVQVYDSDLSFVRGWKVKNFGGTFALRNGGDGTIVAYTARGGMKYRFDTNGQLLNRQPYSGGLNSLGDSGHRLSFPTPWYLWPLESPENSWLIGAFGMVLLFMTEKIKPTFSRPSKRAR